MPFERNFKEYISVKFIDQHSFVFTLQNTENGPVERVFTYNNHIIKQTYASKNIKETTQKQL